MADLLCWDDKYSVGIKAIDENHKQIINYLNTLIDNSFEKKSENFDKKILTILFELNDQLNNNFSIHAKVKEHKTEHLELRKKPSEFLNNFFCRNNDIQIELKLFLFDYFISHILNKD